MQNRNANLTQAQQKFLMDRLRKAVQAKRPSWNCNAEFRKSHPAPKSVIEAEKAIGKYSKIVKAWENHLEEVRKQRTADVDTAYNKAEEQVLFGTSVAARNAVDWFEQLK
jgi:hypothetical protein